MKQLRHFGIRTDSLKKDRIVSPMSREELKYNELKNKKCAVCGKRGTKEEYGGHLCSAKCELEYSQNEEKYL